jgi:hypothetical protein
MTSVKAVEDGRSTPPCALEWSSGTSVLPVRVPFGLKCLEGPRDNLHSCGPRYADNVNLAI